MRLLPISMGVLGREHFGETIQNSFLGLAGNGAKSLDESCLVDRSNLVEHDLSVDALESACNPGGVVSTLGCHWGDNDRCDVVVHFIR